MSDYLFDKTGDPDPEIARLEEALGPLAYRRPAPRLPRRRARVVWISAGVLAAASLVAMLILRPRRPDPILEKPPAVAWLDPARPLVLAIGTVTIREGTRARVVQKSAPVRLRLERGTLNAKIDAPPRAFSVETPRGVVTDLGCAFELTVDESGHARLLVTEGRVALSEDGAPEVVVAPVAKATPAPTPAPALPTPPKSKRAPKPSAKKHTQSAAHAPARPTVTPTVTPTATPTITPTHKKSAAPSPSLSHDALRDLERNAP
jgi:ferric-dicitrate binding protein FerR (iron transport regulator)